MKVLIAPDSFKGSLSAPEAAASIARGWQRVFPNADCIPLPIADGGEGTARALAEATGGRLIPQTVTGPLGEPVTAHYALLGDGATAVVEMAEAAGLALVPPDRRDPKVTTTYGVGELLRAALAEPGIRRVIVTLGGSATNDGGAGLLQALGVRLTDAEGRDIGRGGAALQRIGSHPPFPFSPALTPFPSPADGRGVPVTGSADASRQTADDSVAGTPLPSAGEGKGVRASETGNGGESPEILIACDVDNPLTGPRGASAVFGPQKGAAPADVALLDAALTRYAAVLTAATGRPVAETPGAGAAGGTAAGLLWLFPQATLRPGIEIVLDAVNFNAHLRGAALVLTGEGRLDTQTLGGKAIAGVAQRAKAAGVPVAALVGGLTGELSGALLAEKMGVDAVMPLPPHPCPLDEAIANAPDWLTEATERAARWLRLGASMT